MAKIIDVSPTQSNTNTPDIGHSVIGRMLSLGCAPDSSAVYAGSYSNIWASGDDGQTWDQLTWPQPDPSQFDVPGALGGWCVVDIAAALGWRVEKHPRYVVDLNGGGRAGIVGFGDCGVWTALGNGDGSFQQPNVVIANFGYQAGGWQVDKHPRFVIDLTGDGRGDIVGFGGDGVWTAIGNGDGTFQPPNFVLQGFGYNQGWRVENHPRFVVDLNGDGRADIIGFGDDGVWTAIGNGDGTFQPAVFVLQGFGYNQGWRVENHPRFIADLTGNGSRDIVGFGDAGVTTALGDGHGGFAPAQFVLANFGLQAGGWQVDKHPRFVADLTGNGSCDIVGFGDQGVWTALGDGHGGFAAAQFVLANFGYEQGWRVENHPRFVTSLTGNGSRDIVGFGDAGVWTALGDGHGGFQQSNYAQANFGLQQGWQVDRHPRLIGDLNGNGHADIVGFGIAGVWTAMGDGLGGFPSSNFVLANFGYGTTVLAITSNDRTTVTTLVGTGSRGIWRSTDGGSYWSQVYQFPAGESVGQLQWALGSDHLVYAAGGSALAISKNAGATFQSVFPWGLGTPARVNHVAVWQNSPADPFPAVIYVLGNSTMFLSFDGGSSWMSDNTVLPPAIGASVTSIASGNTPTVMVISPRWPLLVLIAQDGSNGAAIHRGDYTNFLGRQASSWDTLPLPDVIANPNNNDSGQDSGNVFLLTTQKGRGDLLFYGSQRWFGNFGQAAAYVGPLDPQSASDWVQLGLVHVDLHGMLLSPDFEASIKNGNFQPSKGTVWILSDGGIYRSANGGQQFDRARNANTLGCIDVAGVAVEGKPPALSLNSGDNDGFYSMNGGQNWSYQQYGGGDNDCSFSDPLRSHAIMVFTPRWDTAANYVAAHDGQTVSVYQTTPGNLPNAAAGGHDRKAVTGPPTDVSNPWNGGSSFGSRGFRPIVLGLPGEVAPDQGDYIFILSPLTAPVLVRTQNIFDIKHRFEWITTATGPGQGANAYLQGPPLPQPITGMIKSPSLGVVQAAGGHQETVFYVGGDGTLWRGTADAASWTPIVPSPLTLKSVGANVAVRFFVSPYQPNLIYLLDSDHVKRSDDGGQTWHRDQSLETQLTWNAQIALSTNDLSSKVGDFFDLILTDMQFDPNNPSLRIAVGEGGVFLTTDGANWTRVLHTGALTGRPTNCFYDWMSLPSAPALYVGLAGRGLVKITEFL